MKYNIEQLKENPNLIDVGIMPQHTMIKYAHLDAYYARKVNKDGFHIAFGITSDEALKKLNG